MLNRRKFFGAMTAGAAAVAAPGLIPSARAHACSASAPSEAEIKAALAAAYTAHKGVSEGRNADYIPALAKVPSRYFGIALASADGQVREVGDSRQPFTIQSISKPFTMALVMQESGPKLIEDSVGVDATGQAFNSIVAIEQHRGREMNPLVNPGAIATVGNIKGASPEEVWGKIIRFYSACAGRQLQVDAEVYKSESETNQRNRAIGALMSAYERFPMDPEAATDLYTRQCSVSASARDLAIMAATLAFGGRNPVTGQQVIDRALVPGILAVMATAGLYDDSGKWLFQCGLPAKSGVGGGLIAVAPGRFGVAAFSPPLDEAGNSVRSQRAIVDIAQALNANPFAQFG